MPQPWNLRIPGLRQPPIRWDKKHCRKHYWSGIDRNSKDMNNPCTINKSNSMSLLTPHVWLKFSFDAQDCPGGRLQFTTPCNCLVKSVKHSAVLLSKHTTHSTSAFECKNFIINFLVPRLPVKYSNLKWLKDQCIPAMNRGERGRTLMICISVWFTRGKPYSYPMKPLAATWVLIHPQCAEQ